MSLQNNSVLSEIGVRVERTMEIPKGALAPPVKVGLRHDFGVDRNSLPIFYDNLPVGTKIDYPRGTQDSAVVRGASASPLPAGSTRPFNMRRN